VCAAVNKNRRSLCSVVAAVAIVLAADAQSAGASPPYAGGISRPRRGNSPSGMQLGS
jgi:hypothetical protein